MTDPLRVLFVCTANICRSPYLELRARQLAGPGTGVEFASAGTMGFAAHPMDEVMAATLQPGLADEFRSRPLDHTVLAGADLVLTAEQSHRSRILEDHPQHLRRVFTVGQFAAVAAANPGVVGRDLVSLAGRRRSAPTTEQDVSDPYRLGPDAAAAAAARIDDLLRVVVPALTGAPTV